MPAENTATTPSSSRHTRQAVLEVIGHCDQEALARNTVLVFV